MMGPEYEFAETEHDQVLAQLADYLSTLGEDQVSALENYMAQIGAEPETGDMLAQTTALDEDLATVGDYMAQLSAEDQVKITYQMAQKLSEETQEEVFAQIMATHENEMLSQVASYMGQLSEDQL